MHNLFKNYGITHKISTGYHPQTNGLAKLSNKEINFFLARTVNLDRKDWSQKLDDSLWAYRTAYKTPIGMTPYKLVYGKNYNLPLSIQHRADWAIRKCNTEYDKAGRERKLQLHELEELSSQAYDNQLLQKITMKEYHDHKIIPKDLRPGQRVILFNLVSNILLVSFAQNGWVRLLSKSFLMVQ